MISSRGVRRDNWCISSSCSAKGAFQKESFQTSFWTWKTSLAYDFEYPSSDEKICLGKPWWRIGDFFLSMDGGTYGLAICLAAYFRLAVLLHRWSGEVKSFIQCWTHLNPTIASVKGGTDSVQQSITELVLSSRLGQGSFFFDLQRPWFWWFLVSDHPKLLHGLSWHWKIHHLRGCQAWMELEMAVGFRRDSEQTAVSGEYGTSILCAMRLRYKMDHIKSYKYFTYLYHFLPDRGCFRHDFEKKTTYWQMVWLVGAIFALVHHRMYALDQPLE